MSDFDATLTIRVNKESLESFKKNCKTIHGKEHSSLIRELIDGVNDGRVKITPTEQQKQAMGELYNVD